MKIGIFSDTYTPQINGVANQTEYLKKGLERRGHEVHVFCPQLKGHTYTDPHIHTYPVLLSTNILERMLNVTVEGRIALPLINRYSDVAKTLDIIHVQMPYFIAQLGARYSRKYHIPMVLTNHSNYKEYELGVPVNRRLSKWFFENMLKFFIKKCAAVVSPSEEIRQQLIRYYKIKARHEVIYNGVDLKKFDALDKESVKRLQKKYNIQEEDTVMIFVGRLSKEKNLQSLLTYLLPLLKQDSSYKLLFVGDGPQKRPLMLQAKRENVERQVIFAGYVPNEKVPQYLWVSHMCVTASLSEAFPVSLIEAQAAGLPVVAFDSVGISELIKHGYNGYLCTKKEDFVFYCKKLKDVAMRQNMSSYAKKTAGKFSIEHCLDQYESLFQQLIKANKKSN